MHKISHDACFSIEIVAPVSIKNLYRSYDLNPEKGLKVINRLYILRRVCQRQLYLLCYYHIQTVGYRLHYRHMRNNATNTQGTCTLCEPAS